MSSIASGGVTLPMTVENAEAWLRLTIMALKLRGNDAEFLAKAMREYGDARIREYEAARPAMPPDGGAS